MTKINQNNNNTTLIAKLVMRIITNATSINILGAITICILVIVIIFSSYANSYENEGVRIGKEILSGIRSKTSQNTKNSSINIKDYQKELDGNIVQWTRDLEGKLNKDANTQKSISIPNIEQTEEDKKLATEIVAKSEGLIDEALEISQSATTKDYDTDFLIFASFRMGEKNIEGLIEKASRYGCIVVLRGLKGGDFKETARFLLKITEKSKASKSNSNKNNLDQPVGVVIDPTLFEEYGITRVPTYILAKPCISTLNSCKTEYDKLTGNVSPRYALEKFSTQGDLREEARMRLSQ